MTIALESDFRSLKTAQAAEPADRRPVKTGRGEDFASSLRKAREAGTGDAGLMPPDGAQEGLIPNLVAAEPALEAVNLPLPPALPAETEILVPEAAPGSSAAAEPASAPVVVDDSLSEIVVDRALVRESVIAEASRPTVAAALPVAAPPVEAPELSEAAAPAETAPGVRPAGSEPAIAAPAEAIQPAAPKADMAALAALAAAAPKDSGELAAPAIAAELRPAPVSGPGRKAAPQAEQPTEIRAAPASTPSAVIA
ncbi:MAG: hypothetical protein ACK4P2_03135, partial [Hyphomonas sp.]